MNLQEHIRRILKEETYELPKRTSFKVKEYTIKSFGS
jgi:hypothetical protein